jgi:predicted nucleic acid-binding protein
VAVKHPPRGGGSGAAFGKAKGIHYIEVTLLISEYEIVLKIIADVSANMKILRNLEKNGHIEIHVVNIENHKLSNKIKNKKNPVAILDSEFALLDYCVIASDHTPYESIQQIMGKQHHADILHFESHLESKHDLFITEDTDFLSKRGRLSDAFATKIMTPEELAAIF